MPPPPDAALLAELAPLVPVHECAPLVAHQTIDVFGLWRRWETECGRACPVPYWAVVWPGAAVLARYLLDNPSEVAGKTVLELGCGGAAASLAAVMAGAREVVANDIDEVALHVADLNAKANRLELRFSRANLLASEAIDPPADVVLVSEMFYEKGEAERLTRFLDRVHRRGATILVADAGRPFAPQEGMDLVLRRTVPANRDLEGVAERSVRLLKVPGAWCRVPGAWCRVPGAKNES